MSPNDRTYKSFYDRIQSQYHVAISEGVQDPVIVLRRQNTLVPNRNAPFLIAVFSRPEVVRILSVAHPDVAAHVASPSPSRPMTVIIDDQVMTVFESNPAMAYTDPGHEAILSRSLESAEMEWSRARERGMNDPVIEIVDTPCVVGTEVIPIELRVHERSDLAAILQPISSAEVFDAVMTPPPSHTPLTIVIETIAGVSVVNRPAP
jgi:hypothetical protein